MIQRLTGRELATVREAMKHLQLSLSVKNKVLNAIMDYAQISIEQEKKLCAIEAEYQENHLAANSADLQGVHTKRT